MREFDAHHVSVDKKAGWQNYPALLIIMSMVNRDRQAQLGAMELYREIKSNQVAFRQSDTHILRIRKEGGSIGEAQF